MNSHQFTSSGWFVATQPPSCDTPLNFSTCVSRLKITGKTLKSGGYHLNQTNLHDLGFKSNSFSRGDISCDHMGVSENSGTPKSSISIGFSLINHPFWSTPIFGNTHVQAEACAAWCLAPPMSISRRTSFRARMFDFQASRVMTADFATKHKVHTQANMFFWNHQKNPSNAGNLHEMGMVWLRILWGCFSSFLELLRVCWIWWCDRWGGFASGEVVLPTAWKFRCISTSEV